MDSGRKEPALSASIASLSSAPMAAGADNRSVAEVKAGLERVGYLADEPAALVAYLAQELGKPVLVEGPAGVGKTELAKAISGWRWKRRARRMWTWRVAPAVSTP